MSQEPEISEVELNPELQSRLRAARSCFAALERVTVLMASYPPGHPMVEDALRATTKAFYDYFEFEDRLSVLVDAHSLKLLGTSYRVWQTEEPRDYCFAMSRDGIYLLHFLAGIDHKEFRRFIDVLKVLIDERDLTDNAVELLFRSNFRYLSYDALDESLAALAGLESDLRDRDTKEEQELIQELFEQAIDKEAEQQKTDSTQGNFELRLRKRAERQLRFEVGSRQFLGLPEEMQDRLTLLKEGFSDHAELEHRQGEILAAILGAHPKPALRTRAVSQVGNVMGHLLETSQPWESLELLKLIHSWRANFDPTVSGELRKTVTACFSVKRIQQLVTMVTQADRKIRRSILQMFNALHLDEATNELARLLGWDVEEEVISDVIRFLRERAKHDLSFVPRTIFELPSERAHPLLDMAVERLPASKPILMEVVAKPVEPALKTSAIKALTGHISANEARASFAPYLDASHPPLRLAALRGLANTDSARLPLLLGPRLTPKIMSRPEEEIREIAGLYLLYGGEAAREKIFELIRKRAVLVGDEEQALSITLARTLARSPSPEAVSLIRETAADWRVPGKIRAACKELVELLKDQPGVED